MQVKATEGPVTPVAPVTHVTSVTPVTLVALLAHYTDGSAGGCKSRPGGWGWEMVLMGTAAPGSSETTR